MLLQCGRSRASLDGFDSCVTRSRLTSRAFPDFLESTEVFGGPSLGIRLIAMECPHFFIVQWRELRGKEGEIVSSQKSF